MTTETAARTINERWRAYRDDVLPAKASEVQIVECRRAYYAGASALYAALLGKSVRESAAFNGELCAFWHEVEAGRA